MGTDLGAEGGVDGPADGVARLDGGGAACVCSFARRFRRIWEWNQCLGDINDGGNSTRSASDCGVGVGGWSLIWCEFKSRLRLGLRLTLTFTSNVLVGTRRALCSQTNTCLTLSWLIPRQFSYFFYLAAGSSSTREEIQVENPSRSGKEVESTSVWTV